MSTIVRVKRHQAQEQLEWGLPVGLAASSEPEAVTWHEGRFMAGTPLPDADLYFIRAEQCYSCDGARAIRSFDGTSDEVVFDCPVCCPQGSC